MKNKSPEVQLIQKPNLVPFGAEHEKDFPEDADIQAP
jgi:hypothetical protein